MAAGRAAQLRSTSVAAAAAAGSNHYKCRCCCGVHAVLILCCRRRVELRACSGGLLSADSSMSSGLKVVGFDKLQTAVIVPTSVVKMKF